MVWMIALGTRLFYLIGIVMDGVFESDGVCAVEVGGENNGTWSDFVRIGKMGYCICGVTPRINLGANFFYYCFVP